MGEEKKKKDKASKADPGDKKKDAALAPAPAEQAIVLKVDLHCAGCASKVKRAIKHAPGMCAHTSSPFVLIRPTLPFPCLFFPTLCFLCRRGVCQD
jgi:hypothetical protein